MFTNFNIDIWRISVIYIHSHVIMQEELHLECIHEKILELQEQRKIRLTANILYDRLFAHFLSTFRSEYSYNDLHCFLKIVSNERHHVSQSVLAYYLKRTLKSHFDEATTLKVNSQVSLTCQFM